jgi:phospholipid/cholesterol/gamma-HCH transport system substrate-binding protein
MGKIAGRSMKLGVFITIGLLLFIVAIYSIGKQRHLFGASFRISTIFKNVAGLQVGNNVRLAGINVGTVYNIEIISDTSVVVDLLIDEKARKHIKKDARATIGSEGLMGNKIINILPGNGDKDPVERHDFIIGAPSVEIDDIISTFQSTIQNIDLITSDLAEITNRVRSGRSTIGALLMDTTLAFNLYETLRQARKGTEGFKESMDAVQESVLLRGYFKRKEKEEAKAADTNGADTRRRSLFGRRKKDKNN